MLRVCIATTSFPRRPGDGRGSFIYEECRALQALGVRIRVVTPHSPGAKTRETVEGMEIFRPPYLWPERLEAIDAAGGGLPSFWEARRLGRAAVLPYGMSLALAVARIACGCDLIHAHWSLPAYAAWITRGLHRKPLVCTILGSDIYRGMQIPLAGGLARRALNGASRILALSRALAEAAQARGVNADRMTVIPLGVDCAAFHPGDDRREKVILFAGSLIERKGVRHLLAAIAELRASFPDYRLVLLGDGAQRAELEALAASLGIRQIVEFAGEQPPAAVAEWMRRAALFVLPSLEEGLGAVLLEASASGTPVVASKVGGIPEVITEGTGRLVMPGNPAALAEAIGGLLRKPDQLRAMGLRARERASSRFDWPQIAARILAEYSQALAGPAIR
jgi:glycosyltransferase involved in cell wall biosynthesis